jgi:uncharacterized protein (DUF1015 family)
MFKPLHGLRPKKEYAKEVCCLPYDVMNRQEAYEMARDNPHSFLHIIRSEIDLDASVGAYSDAVYEKAAENLSAFIRKGILARDARPCYYVYMQIMDGRSQTGIFGLNGIDDYKSGAIKKHELTLPQKEEDRIWNFLACRAHTEPIMLLYKSNTELERLLEKIKSGAPEYDFTDAQGISQQLWVVDKKEDVASIEHAFDGMDSVYIADGHHRAASSYRSGEMMRAQCPDCDGTEQFNFIMSVCISENDLMVMDYNRLVADTGKYGAAEFLAALESDFTVTEKQDLYITSQKHTFSMYLEGRWYALEAKSGSFDENDPVKSLDASILQDNVFEKLLHIDDPRTSSRLSFVGGIRGYEALKDSVDSGGAKAAFGVFPVSVADLISVADNGLIMPPKSTWFEPKLRSGLVIHEF